MSSTSSSSQTAASDAVHATDSLYEVTLMYSDELIRDSFLTRIEEHKGDSPVVISIASALSGVHSKVPVQVHAWETFCGALAASSITHISSLSLRGLDLKRGHVQLLSDALRRDVGGKGHAAKRIRLDQLHLCDVPMDLGLAGLYGDIIEHNKTSIEVFDFSELSVHGENLAQQTGESCVIELLKKVKHCDNISTLSISCSNVNDQRLFYFVGNWLISRTPSAHSLSDLILKDTRNTSPSIDSVAVAYLLRQNATPSRLVLSVMFDDLDKIIGAYRHNTSTRTMSLVPRRSMTNNEQLAYFESRKSMYKLLSTADPRYQSLAMPSILGTQDTTQSNKRQRHS
jgi:hypothetical protein